MTQYRNRWILIGGLMAVGLISCKTTQRSNRSGGGGANGQNSTSKVGSKSDWVTPLNLVDITAPVQDSTRVPLIGEIENIKLDNPADVFSSGVIEVSGMRVIIPANLIIEMPNGILTLQELFTKARPECKAKNQTGLALADDCFYERRGAQATINANRTGSGAVIAGEVKIAKGLDFVQGTVTFIDYTSGYFRLNGDPNTKNSTNKTTGMMVRINDPTSRHTIQSGLGCDNASPNCSADIRFAVLTEGYTAASLTGYPMCIPSTKGGGKRTRPATAQTDAKSGSMTVKTDDQYCPYSNRPADPSKADVRDSQYFAPIALGDGVDVTGNFELIGTGANQAYFLSAQSVKVYAGLKTTPGKPDYLSFSENMWETAPYARQRTRAFWIGNSTDPNSAFDLYRLAIDPNDANPSSREHEVPFASTVNNPKTFNLGVIPTINNIFRIRYRDLFAANRFQGGRGRQAPCDHLFNAGVDGGCAGGATLDPFENFKVMSPLSRDVFARTRNKKAHPTLASFDINGQAAPNGIYKLPTEVDHPDFAEINLNRVQTPFFFTGESWLLDRRTGPEGCGGDHGACASAAGLTPFPTDGGLDPRFQNLGGGNLPIDIGNRMIMSYPYTNTTDGPLLPWDQVNVPNTIPVTASSPVIFSQCKAVP